MVGISSERKVDMARQEIDFAAKKHIWQSYVSPSCVLAEVAVFLYCILFSALAKGQAERRVGAGCVVIVMLALAGAYVAYSGLKIKGRIYRDGLKIGLVLNLAVIAAMVALYIWGSTIG